MPVLNAQERAEITEGLDLGAGTDPPAPDGYLVVHWMDGKVMSYLFSDMGRFGWGPSKNWDGDVSGTTGMMFVHTCDGTVRNEIPLVSVRFVEVVKNSDDYREALRSWQKQYGGSASLLRAVDL